MKKRVNMETMMAAMFYRKQPVSEIKKMEYHEMKFWYEMHEIIEKAWAKANDGK